MATIVPTITTAERAQFDALIQEFQGFSKRIHVDFSDGTFASTVMLPLDQMSFPEGVAVDIHIMAAKPSQYLAQVINLKPSLVIVHAEVDDDLPAIFQQLKAANIKTGVALLKSSFPRKYQEYIAQVDHVMIFAGKLGEQGGGIDLLQIEKVPLVRALKKELEISWDGGVNLSNIRAVAHANVDVIDVGSAITKAADKPAMYKSLVAECEKKGVMI